MKTGDRVSLYKPRGRQVPAKTRLFLFTQAGGRCEFDGCNRYLLEHPLTRTVGVFAQMAHIFAFSDRGPRAVPSGSTAEKHALANLILLCPECHKLVDDDPETYSASVLRKHKKAHEDRIFILTDTKPDRQTVAFVLRARIADQSVAISRADMEAAVAPRYLGRDVVECNLTALRDQVGCDYWQVSQDAIQRAAAGLYTGTFDGGPARHVSVFALAPIPLLVFLGTQLSSKVPTSMFQRHRDSEDWKWKTRGEAVSFQMRQLRKGTQTDRLALLLSLSGPIEATDLPAEIDARYTITEIAPASQRPSPNVLRLEATFHAFRTEFMATVRQLVARHQGLRAIDLFPAVPAPVATAVGRDLLPKRDPSLRVYDYNKRAGGFSLALEVNQNET